MRVTKAEYEQFKSYCIEWCEKLSISTWSLHFDRANIDDAYARTYWKNEAHVATIVLTKDWDNIRPKNSQELKRLALHEVLHLLMAPLTHQAEQRYSTQESVDTAEHTVIRSLENHLYGL